MHFSSLPVLDVLCSLAITLSLTLKAYPSRIHQATADIFGAIPPGIIRWRVTVWAILYYGRVAITSDRGSRRMRANAQHLQYAVPWQWYPLMCIRACGGCR